MTFDTRGRQTSGGGGSTVGGSNIPAANVDGTPSGNATTNASSSAASTTTDSTTAALTNSSVGGGCGGGGVSTTTTNPNMATTTINIGQNTTITLGGGGIVVVGSGGGGGGGQQLEQPTTGTIVPPIAEMSSLSLHSSSSTSMSTSSSSSLVPAPAPSPATTVPTTSTSPATVVVSDGVGGAGGSVGVNGGAITSADSVSPEKLLLVFPTSKLRMLTQKISNPRWVVPVLPEQELEVLLNAAIALTVAGVDHDSEPCVEFYRNALSTSFAKILNDEAVNSWKINIHNCILMSCGKLLHLIAIHMSVDNPYLLELLAMVFDPDNKFNTFNAIRQPECFVPPDGVWGTLDAGKLVYATPPLEKNPRGWLVDLINRFGQLGGFDQLLERFNAGLLLLRRQQQEAAGNVGADVLPSTSTGTIATLVGDTNSGGSGADSGFMLAHEVTAESCRMSVGGTSSTTTMSGTSGQGVLLGDEQDNRLTLSLIYSLLRPFGQCYELLTAATIAKYFMPIWNVVLDLLDSFSDDELKREVKTEGRTDYINGIVKSARLLASRLPGQEELIRDLEMFRLKMILRLLQVSSFNGKMNALNEINKVLTSVSYYAHRTQQLPHCLPDDEMDWLTAERMACWIKESDVLGIVLKDSLHQPQYVEKLEKIIRFLIKERALTLEDLDAVWRAQKGKHEAIVKNVHDLLAKLAWDFTPEQLDHLFESFQASMTTANKRQRERLLELIRRLAEDDKNGVMAQKVLKLFWTLAHSQEIPPEVMDAALVAHVKILDYSCSQERDAQKIVWLDKCVAELKQGDEWVLPALRLIREICCLYESSPSHAPRTQQTLNRQQVIERLQNDNSLVILVTNSLTAYMDRIRRMLSGHGGQGAAATIEPRSLCIDGRYPHTMQIQDRLDFLKFLLKDGQLWLCADQAKQIWHCLAVNAIFASDREECFRWFGKLMGDEPDLDPGINKDFFEHNILQLEPHLLTESGIKCFERFFKAVNSKEDKLKLTQRGYILDKEDLIGKEYLWHVITTGGEEIAAKAIDLLKEVSTALGPRLQENICEFHEIFIGECCKRLRKHYACLMGRTAAVAAAAAASGSSDAMSCAVDECDADGPATAAMAAAAATVAAIDHKMRCMEAEKMCRILKVLQEYIKECDRAFNGDRTLLPLGRVGRGKHTSLYIRFQNPGRPLEDHEVTTHNNETVASFKRQLLKRINKGGASMAAATPAPGVPGGVGGGPAIGIGATTTTTTAVVPATPANVKIELYYNNGELIEISDEINPLSHYSIRDKMILTAKLSPMGGAGTAAAAGLASSPDSSSDSSTGSPPRPCPDVARVESETTLPGVIIAQRYHYMEFFLKLYQLGCDLEHGRLRESARTLLHLLPCDRHTVRMVQIMCRVPGTESAAKAGIEAIGELTPSSATTAAGSAPAPADPAPSIDPLDCTPEMLFLHPSPSQVLYNLGVLNGLLIPALDPFGEAALQIQSSWLHSGCAHFILELLTKNNFLANADMYTKRTAFQCVLRLAKLFLYVMGSVLARVGDEPLLVGAGSAGAADLADIGARSQVELLKQILVSIPSSAESAIRTISTKLAEQLAAEMLSASEEGERCRQLFASTLRWACPDTATIKAVVQLAWASSCGRLQALASCTDFGDDITMPDPQDFTLCKEALEVLTIALVLSPSANEALSADPMWPKFITSLILKSPSRHVRQYAAEQLFLSCTYCAGDRRPFAYMVQLLVSSLRTLVPQHEATCADFFQLLCRTLSYGCVCNWPLNVGEGLLAEEIAWLRKIRENVRQTGEIGVHEDLLEGHLYLAKELMFFLTVETKTQLTDLIHELIDDFLFTASREYLHLRKQGRLKHDTAPPPVCRSSHTIAAGCDLLIAVCQNSVPNMKLITSTLIDFVCTDTEPLREWDYIPPVGARPPKGFCGLKNAGATCYMNSVLQQLYMVLSIRVGILRADGAATNDTEDFSGEPETVSSSLGSVTTTWVPHYSQLGAVSVACGPDAVDSNDVRKNYHVVILKHVQAIFAHLGHSSLQYYVPRGLWTHFKLQGEPVNLREQQDAVEFFMSLFESLDEGLKALGHTQLMNATLGGSFSDQKICQECPHRYSKEEPFSVFSVDIRNHSSLTESLEQYVKGELLEGADAYHCDKCDKKVVTIKRLCVRKLPPVLAIQLKRFEYDYERVCAIKFNDYFEFPRVLDMEPYTVSGLAKLEGEVIEIGENCQSNGETTKYELTGIVVHSGQASGGHYFSYILSKNPSTGKEQWYKFDDGEVTECKMHEDEEMKTQCFGGDYMGEIYDNNLKRMQYRRQKRWWNAYMLFYTRCDQRPVQFEQSVEQLSLAESKNFVLPLPKPIEKSVRGQNIRFLHSKSIFSVEFFMFMRKLVSCFVPSVRPEKMLPHAEELSLLSIQLASQFLFHTGFRTKKTIRGPVIDWYDTLSHHIRGSSQVRNWFANNALLNPSSRLGEYILMAPSPEVRTVFVKLVVFFCHFAIGDEPLAGFEGSNLCEQVLICVLRLLKSEVADHGKNLPHYFSLFSMYVGLGALEKQQLLKLNVPVIFMQVALDEGPGPSIKYQYPELSKLHQVVSHLIRCSDVSDKCQSSSQNARPLPNPHKDPAIGVDDLMPLSPDCFDILFNRTGYIKKLIEDTNVGEEGLKLLQYCSWENPHFSRAVLTELLWQCGFAYCHDMRHHTELLLHILLIDDSWQHHRIHNALTGVAEEREGLLETIHRTKAHYQKRAYQIIKCLTQLFHKSTVALTMLNSNTTIARQWVLAVEWLQDELERQRGIGCQYNSYSWSPPAQSNDNTNGYMLERSQSAKNTWSLACELCPEEEQEETNESDVEAGETTGDAGEYVAPAASAGGPGRMPVLVWKNNTYMPIEVGDNVEAGGSGTGSGTASSVGVTSTTTTTVAGTGTTTATTGSSEPALGESNINGLTGNVRERTAIKNTHRRKHWSSEDCYAKKEVDEQYPECTIGDPIMPAGNANELVDVQLTPPSAPTADLPYFDRFIYPADGANTTTTATATATLTSTTITSTTTPKSVSILTAAAGGVGGGIGGVAAASAASASAKSKSYYSVNNLTNTTALLQSLSTTAAALTSPAMTTTNKAAAAAAAAAANATTAALTATQHLAQPIAVPGPQQQAMLPNSSTGADAKKNSAAQQQTVTTQQQQQQQIT